MVFAAWAVRTAAPAPARRELEAVLADALETGLASLPAIAARRRDVGLSEAEIAEYLRSFTYRIGPAEEKAVAEYRRLLTLLDS